ncbi:MAG: TetR/AcrR family transcriptional regulator [Myxococcales bacterium]|nr:TetR/AcrR family transcriptional regulator [Myxococcales bacterium]
MARRHHPRQERSRFTVQAILGAVSRVLKADGAEAVTTSRIAKAAGVSVGTLYQYFANKQDIFDALHERNLVTMSERVNGLLASREHGSLEGLLRALLRVVVEVRSEDPELQRLLATTVPWSSESAAKASHLRRAIRDAVEPYRHELRDDVDLDTFLFVTIQMVVGLSRGVVLSRPASLSMQTTLEASEAALAAYVARCR